MEPAVTNSPTRRRKSINPRSGFECRMLASESTLAHHRLDLYQAESQLSIFSYLSPCCYPLDGARNSLALLLKVAFSMPSILLLSVQLFIAVSNYEPRLPVLYVFTISACSSTACSYALLLSRVLCSRGSLTMHSENMVLFKMMLPMLFLWINFPVMFADAFVAKLSSRVRTEMGNALSDPPCSHWATGVRSTLTAARSTSTAAHHCTCLVATR